MGYTISLVRGEFAKDRWEEISALAGSAFGTGKSAGHVSEVINDLGESELGHLIAESADGNILGAILCVPVNRPEHATSCDLDCFFVDTTLPPIEQMRIADAMVEGVHEELGKQGYQMVVTGMGAGAEAEFFGERHGYMPAPTAGNSNRRIRSLRTIDDGAINGKSTQGKWDLAGDQQARYASVEIGPNEIIIDLKPLLKRVKHPSAYTLQLAEGVHYQIAGGTLGLNHHCNPNGYLCFEDLTYRARCDISAGEALSFHYCTTEYELDNPFDCLCGSADCLGRVGGFKFLKECEIEKISSLLSPFLQSKLPQAVT